jgi:hypothetical protein
LAALIIAMLERLYDETSRVRSALRSIGRLLTANTTVETVPAISGMSMPATVGAASVRRVDRTPHLRRADPMGNPV